ncbi:MAG: hypothetical protein U5K79_02100 [Cyclobacteriaceae bacterium]|nr:hypothetical protein [Cyclobacteriaceae bacterium]
MQFIKGGLLVFFSTILTFYILNNGMSLTPNENYHKFLQTDAIVSGDTIVQVVDPAYSVKKTIVVGNQVFVQLEKGGELYWFNLNKKGENAVLDEMLHMTTLPDGSILYNGAPKSEGKFYQVGHLKQNHCGWKRGKRNRTHGAI